MQAYRAAVTLVEKKEKKSTAAQQRRCTDNLPSKKLRYVFGGRQGVATCRLTSAPPGGVLAVSPPLVPCPESKGASSTERAEEEEKIDATVPDSISEATMALKPAIASLSAGDTLTIDLLASAIGKDDFEFVTDDLPSLEFQ